MPPLNGNINPSNGNTTSLNGNTDFNMYARRGISVHEHVLRGAQGTLRSKLPYLYLEVAKGEEVVQLEALVQEVCMYLCMCVSVFVYMFMEVTIGENAVQLEAFVQEMCIYMHAYIQTYIHTYIHACMHA
jgi:hypothetical protein